MRSRPIAYALFAAILSCAAAQEPTVPDHTTRYAQGIPDDPAIEAARTLQIKVPVMCREWHVWWGAPYGSGPHYNGWHSWGNQQIMGKFDPQTTIESTVPGMPWRRNLNCTGYPLLGPYDSNQPDIIRWQLQTAKNSGLECLHIHLWPSIWDDGRDFTPMPILDSAFDTAARLQYPVAVHDEVMFRNPKITRAQTLESCIARTANLLRRYGSHPGWYKIDGQPVYYLQFWNRWITAETMQTYMERVEALAGPVYWIAEGFVDEKMYAIPQLKALLAQNNSTFLREPQTPENWNKLIEDIQSGKRLAQKYHKKFGVLVYTRFNCTNHRMANDFAQGKLAAEDGQFFLQSLKRMAEVEPDFYVLTQWNDFQECAFVEPGWDFDGFNGDPYRYCRMIAASMGKQFTPAELPKRSELDPRIRQKLFGTKEVGDAGPVLEHIQLQGRTLTAQLPAKEEIVTTRIVQETLARWTPGLRPYHAESLRLGNYGTLDDKGGLKGNGELRFYAPGLRDAMTQTMWVGIRVRLPSAKAELHVTHHGESQVFRQDSRWESSKAWLKQGFPVEEGENAWQYWAPMYNAKMDGLEGDLLIRVLQAGKDEITYIDEVVLWTKEMAGADLPPATVMTLPDTIKPELPFVVVGFDALGNAGTPRLFRNKKD